MITLLNFIDTGFIITLGLLLLVSGAVMLYCYRRLNILENSIIEHGKILQNFIMNYNNQNQIIMQSLNPNVGNMENEEMNENLETTYDDTRNIQIDNRISVSDDEEYTDSENSVEEEDSSEEYTDDSNSDIEEENEINVKKIVINDEDLEEKTIKLESDLPLEVNDLKLDSKKLELDLSEEIKNNTEKKNFSRMKVDDLRILAVTKNLTDNEKAQQMKKSDLVKLLQD
tara:strand:- start:219 stop:902 length:684 start_codon:yes stop_codon:yes gene_type:complete